MSVVGFDVGNDTSCVALARKRGIDVVMNKESKRETPAAINYGGCWLCWLSLFLRSARSATAFGGQRAACGPGRGVVQQQPRRKCSARLWRIACEPV